MQLNDGRLPIDMYRSDFRRCIILRFLEIADCIQTKIAAVTDNDGDFVTINKKA